MNIRKSILSLTVVATLLANVLNVVNFAANADNGTPVNVAQSATVTAQNYYNDDFKPENVNDGTTDTEWARAGNDGGPSTWINFAWDSGVTIAEMYLADSKAHDRSTTGGTITVTAESKDYTFDFENLPFNGDFLKVTFDKAFTGVTNVKIDVKSEAGGAIGLSEVVLLDEPGENPVKNQQVRYVSDLGCNLSVDDGSLETYGEGKDKYITATGKSGGHMTWGGHLFLTGGFKYKITVRAMIDSGANADSLLCEFDDLGKAGLPSKQFFVRDFKTPGQWEDLTFEVDLSDKGLNDQFHIESRMFYHNTNSAKLSIHYYTAEAITERTIKANVIYDSDEPITFEKKTFEAEKDLGSNTGTKDDFGIYATPKNPGGYIVWGGNTDLEPGQYLMVVYAKISTPSLIGTETPIARFDGTGKGEHAYVMTGADFTKANVYEAIKVPLNITEKLTAEMRWFYYPESGTILKIDKIVLMDARDELDEPSQEFDFTQKIFECETDALGSNTGKKDGFGILATPTDAGGHIVWGGNTELAPGKYKMRVYARINNAGIVGTDTDIMRFDGCNDENIFVMKGTDFTKANEYQAIEYTLNIKEKTTTEIRWFYYPESGTSIKIDKIILMDENDIADDPIQEPGDGDVGFEKKTFEAEELGNKVGYTDHSGRVGLASVDGSDHIVFGGNTTLSAGNYKLVLYAKLLNDAAVGRDVRILNFDGAGDPYSHPVKGSDFAKSNYYYAIEIPLNLIDTTSFEIRFWYFPESGADIKIDKIVLMSASDTPDEPVQEVEQKPQRPEGETVHDTFVYTLSDENITFIKDSIDGTTGRTENGSIIFDASKYVGGGIDVAAERPYIATGSKVMRFYLRLMDVPTSTSELMKIYTMRYNNDIKLDVPGTVISVKTQDFGGLYNTPVMIEIPIETEDCYGYSFKIDWHSTASIAVDRVEITDPGTEEYTVEPVEVETTAENGGYAAVIENTDVIKNLSPFGSVAIKADGATYYLSFASISENVIQNGNKIKIWLSKADSDNWSAINAAARRSKVFVSGYDAYTVTADVINPDGTTSPMKSHKANMIAISASSDTLNGKTDKMYGFEYDLKENTLTPSSEKLNTQTGILKFSAPESNVYLIGVATEEYIISLTSQYDKDFPERVEEDYYDDGNGGKSPQTGEDSLFTIAVVIMMLSGIAVTVCYVKKSKKNN